MDVIEVLRRNILARTINYSTLASMDIGDNTAIVHTANANMLVSGVNVITVGSGMGVYQVEVLQGSVQWSVWLAVTQLG